jgi:hypothetical protein
VFRETSELREHVTLLPPILVLLDTEGAIEAIHHLTPLWVFPREYVSSRFAESVLDPANVDVEVLNALQRQARGALKFKQSPPGIPAPSEFPRFVAASPSGNVNSTIIRNYFRVGVIPEIRALGVSVQENGVVLTDRHGSHEDQEFLTDLEEKQNAIPVFGPPHATDRFQLQDASHGPFQVLKSQSKKDTLLWHKHVSENNLTLSVEDAPFVFQRAYTDSKEDKVTRRALKNIAMFPRDPDKVFSKMLGAKLYTEYAQQFAEEEEATKTHSHRKPQQQQEGEEDAENGEAAAGNSGSGKSGKVDLSDEMFFRTASQPQQPSSPALRHSHLANVGRGSRKTRMKSISTQALTSLTFLSRKPSSTCRSSFASRPWRRPRCRSRGAGGSRAR